MVGVSLCEDGGVLGVIAGDEFELAELFFALVVDAEIYRLGLCIRCPLYALLSRGFMRVSSELCRSSMAAYRDFVGLVRRSAEIQAEVVALGVFGCIEKHAPELVALQKRAQARLCVADSGFSPGYLSGQEPYWLGLPE